MEIKVFRNTLGNNKFYQLMGKYFAEREYKKEMPYLINQPDNTWFIMLVKNKVIGFVAIEEKKNKILLKHAYIEKEYRGKGLWEQLNEFRLDYIKDKSKTLEVVVKEEFMLKYWKDSGFKVHRQNGRYFYLRKDAEK